MKHTFYALINSDYPDRFLTLTLKKEEASEYARKFLYFQHLEHYKNWCYVRQIDCDDFSWQEYYKTISIEEKNKYQIVKLKFHKKGIAALLRMLYCCVPIGTSIDQDIEYQYLFEKSRNINERVIENGIE